MLGYVPVYDITKPFEKALQEPNMPLHKFAALLQLDGQYDASLQLLNDYLVDHQDDEPAQYLKSLILLAGGEYNEGFKLYEHRFSMYPEKSKINQSFPKWDGKPTDRRIFVWQEGGFGDVIHFSRYFLEVLRKAPNTIFMVHPSMITLLASAGIPLYTMPRTQGELDFTDETSLQCSIQSLPAALGVILDQVQGEPYLKVSEEAKTRWAPTMTNRPKVGFCWRGNPSHERDSTRSLTDDLAQKFGERHDMISLVGEHLTGVNDWMDTAAVVSHLDVVVTVDTAMAHLAGALGKTTLMMIPVDNDWRWGISGVSTPWYDSMKLFRCPKHGDWQTVMDEVSKTMSEHVPSIRTQ